MEFPVGISPNAKLLLTEKVNSLTIRYLSEFNEKELTEAIKVAKELGNQQTRVAKMQKALRTAKLNKFSMTETWKLMSMKGWGGGIGSAYDFVQKWERMQERFSNGKHRRLPKDEPEGSAVLAAENECLKRMIVMAAEDIAKYSNVTPANYVQKLIDRCGYKKDEGRNGVE